MSATHHLKLFFAPATRATRPRWLLEEMGVPYELVTLNMKEGAHKLPAYKGPVHPHGVVPALEIDGQILIESGAILATLADLYPEKNLAPPSGTRERARYYEWLFYAYATLESAVHDMSVAHHPDKEKALARWEEVASFVEMRLGDRTWCTGETFTAADCAVGSVVIWASALKLLDGRPHMQAYAERCKARPAFQRARKA